MHKDTHALKLLDAFPLSSPSPPPPLSCPVFHRCGCSCALSIFLSSFIPPPFRLRSTEQRGGFSSSCNAGLRWIDGDTPAAALPARHTLCVTLPFPSPHLASSLFLSRAAMHSVHSSSYLPPNPPSPILFIDIDVSALCLHPSLSSLLLLRLLLHFL